MFNRKKINTMTIPIFRNQEENATDQFSIFEWHFSFLGEIQKVHCEIISLVAFPNDIHAHL